MFLTPEQWCEPLDEYRHEHWFAVGAVYHPTLERVMNSGRIKEIHLRIVQGRGGVVGVAVRWLAAPPQGAERWSRFVILNGEVNYSLPSYDGPTGEARPDLPDAWDEEGL